MLLALYLSAASFASPQTAAPAAKSNGWIENGIDRAIANLPRVECEGGWNGMAGYTVNRGARELRAELAIGARMTDEQWTRALETAGVLRTREKWPAGVPVAVSMNKPAWLHPVEMYAVPRDVKLMSLEAGDLAHLHCGIHVEEMCAEKQRKAEYQEIGTLEIGKHHIVFDVTVEEGSTENGTSFGAAFVHDPRPKQPPGTVLWRGPLAIDIEVVPTLEDAMPANDSKSLSEIVLRSLRRVRSSAEGGEADESDVHIGMSAAACDISNTALSLELELYSGDACVARGWTLARKFPDYGGCWGISVGRRIDTIDLGGADLDLPSANPPRESLQLRVRGVPRDVLRDMDATQWWSGTISVPLSSLTETN